METRELKLVPPRGGGGVPLAAGVLVLAALLATWSGADDARKNLDRRETAETTLQLALERGREDAEVRRSLAGLRSTFGRRPLDARTRVVYAGLLLGVGRTETERRLAAFHARRAAELAPVTVPVVRAAALVLASTGDDEESIGLIHAMFGYDPVNAAQVLTQVELLFSDEQVASALPETPLAWMTWARQYRVDGRDDQAREWEWLTAQRWPDHLPALERVASRALQEDDLERLAALFHPGRELPLVKTAATVFLARARLEAERGERTAALADVKTAIGLDEASPSIRMYAGDVLELLGQTDEAADEWNRALHLLRGSRDGSRRHVLFRLARLEQRNGRPAAALRLWKSLLELDPDHVEARRRVDDLTGFQR